MNKSELKQMKELFLMAAEEVDQPGDFSNEYIGACSAFTRSRNRMMELRDDGVWTVSDYLYGAGGILKRMMRPNSNQSYWLGELNEKNKKRRVYCLLIGANALEDFV